MIGNRRFLAVVPARGGSVSVPRKNIKPLHGRPLIAYTLEQARRVAEIDLTVVSTDDTEIAAVARGLGVRVIARPAALATNEASTEQALIHALDALEGEAWFDYVMVLQPTSPLRSAETVRTCMSRIAASDAPSLVTVNEVHESVGRVENGWFRRLDPSAARRRQDREPLYSECGSVYICRVDHLRQTGSLVADRWLAVQVPQEETLDINSPTDFTIAEAIISRRSAT